MDLICPNCAGPLQGTAAGNVTVIVCAKCSQVIRIPHDGGAHALAIASTVPAPPPVSQSTLADAPKTLPLPDECCLSTALVADEQFGDYQILARIAHGGMGVVYKARQISLNRVVALKMILGGQLVTDDQVRRFQIEAEAAAQLDHPGIVPVYEVGQHRGLHYYSMGYVEGTSLSDRLADGPLPPCEAATLMVKAARAVAYAHVHGVVHRDLKPSNILVDSTGQPRVTDFGLAKRVEADSELTRAGGVLGTPSYMPPEQATGRTAEVGVLADVYALGATLYCLLTGRPPFQAAHVAETLRQVIEQDPVSPRLLNATVDRDLETICLKCLEKRPSQRFASATELADDLDRFLRGEPIRARPVSGLERTWKWIRRHPASASLIGTVASAALVVIGLLTWFNARLTQQRDEADAFADQAFLATDELRQFVASGGADHAFMLTPGRRRQFEAGLERYQAMLPLLRGARIRLPTSWPASRCSPSATPRSPVFESLSARRMRTPN